MRRWLFRFLAVPAALAVLRVVASHVLPGDTVHEAVDLASLQRELSTARDAEVTARRCADELRALAPALVERGIAAGRASATQPGAVPLPVRAADKADVQVAATAAVEEIARLVARASAASAGDHPPGGGVGDLGSRAQLIAEGICAARNVAQAATGRRSPSSRAAGRGHHQ